jgi:hypothetical protein
MSSFMTTRLTGGILTGQENATTLIFIWTEFTSLYNSVQIRIQSIVSPQDSGNSKYNSWLVVRDTRTFGLRALRFIARLLFPSLTSFYLLGERHSWTIYLWLYSPLLGLGLYFSFLLLYTFGRTRWTGDQPVSRPLPIHRTTQTQNKHTQTSLCQVGFEPTIPAFERAKIVHALDRATTGS